MVDYRCLNAWRKNYKVFLYKYIDQLSEVVVLLEGKLLTYKKTFNSSLSKMNIHLLSQVWIKIIVQFDSEFFLEIITTTPTAQKMKFSTKDFFSKCDQIRTILRIWSHLLKKSLMENFIFHAVQPYLVIFLLAYFNLNIWTLPIRFVLEDL